VYGWPRISFSVHGIDFLGRDVIRGYGSLLIPPIAGQYERDVPMYLPASNSLFADIMGWLTGTQPEYHDIKTSARGDNRAVTRVVKAGLIRVKFNVSTKGMTSFGYSANEPLQGFKEGQSTIGMGRVPSNGSFMSGTFG